MPDLPDVRILVAAMRTLRILLRRARVAKAKGDSQRAVYSLAIADAVALNFAYASCVYWRVRSLE
jgi:hypothetical protein